MKNLIKVASILLISAMVTLFSTTVNAADNEAGFIDLTGAINNTSSNNTSGNTNTNTGNSNSSTNANSNTANKNTNSNKNTNTNSNSSKYNNTNKNTDLPKTGIEDSIPVVLLVVVFGISAVYAYKKVDEYKNI